MTLERALEVAIKVCEAGLRNRYYDDSPEAAAVLREFKEKELPFYRAAEGLFEHRYQGKKPTWWHDFLGEMHPEQREWLRAEFGKVEAAYRAMKEATK